MPTPAALQTQIPKVASAQIKAEGFAAWIAWSGDLNPVLVQTLEDYGGLVVAEDADSSLWFFFSTDAVLASARLAVWSRFNQLAVNIQIFPASVQVDLAGAIELSADEAFWKQQIDIPADFLVWVHTSMQKVTIEIPGLSLATSKDKLPKGMAADKWLLLDADGRLPYQASLGWYVLLHPVGNPIDKTFQNSWREFFAHVEAILQRNKFRFTIHDFFLMFPLDGLRQFKNWCKDYLMLVVRLKQEHPEQYWPCVSAVIDRKGLNFNQELPNRVPLQWERLTPDYPHLSMRNALIAGKDFAFHEVGFAANKQSSDDWAVLSLRDGGSETVSLPQFVPSSLLLGSHPYCFYCGQRSHETQNCPTRNFPAHSTKVWNQVAQLNFDDMRTAVQDIDKRLDTAGDNKQEAIAQLIIEETAAGVLTNAFFDINWILQLRAVNIFWRARSKDIQKFATELAPMDDSSIWTALDAFTQTSSADMEKELHALATKYPKDFRIMSLRGFVALERGEYERAQFYWKDAELYSGFPIIQAWHVLLQARLQEFLGRYTQAGILYDQVSRSIVSWWDTKYRYMVCMVKNGFSDASELYVNELVEKSGHYFNKILLDPELERGRIQASSQLFRMWTLTEAKSKDELARLRRLHDDLTTWFVADNDFAAKLAEKIKKLIQLSEISNYVAFQMLVTGRQQLEKELQTYVLQEGRELKTKFKALTDRLQVIHDESAWFPFRSALKDFNKNYNIGAANMNWAARANLHVPEAFRKAQLLAEQEEERIKEMEGRMRFLRMVRDSTLFFLSVGETFFWAELLGVILIFIILPLILVYGDKVGFDMTASIITKERWAVQKALFIVVSLVALLVSAMRTLLRFERIRDKIILKAKKSSLARQEAARKKMEKAKKK